MSDEKIFWYIYDHWEPRHLKLKKIIKSRIPLCLALYIIFLIPISYILLLVLIKSAALATNIWLQSLLVIFYIGLNLAPVYIGYVIAICIREDLTASRHDRDVKRYISRLKYK